MNDTEATDRAFYPTTYLIFEHLSLTTSMLSPSDPSFIIIKGSPQQIFKKHLLKWDLLPPLKCEKFFSFQIYTIVKIIWLKTSLVKLWRRLNVNE